MAKAKKPKTPKVETFDFRGYSGHPVPCPELSAFLDALDDVCEHFGMGFRVDEEWGEGRSKVIIVPYDEAEWVWATQDLDEYRGGVPALDAAKSEQDRLQAEADTARMTEQIRYNQQLAEAQAADLIRNGLVIGGQRFKVVKE